MQRAIVNGMNGAHVSSSASSASGSGSGSSKHVRCIGRYVVTGTNLGKGNFARVEAAVHTLTRSKVRPLPAIIVLSSLLLPPDGNYGAIDETRCSQFPSYRP